MLHFVIADIPFNVRGAGEYFQSSAKRYLKAFLCPEEDIDRHADWVDWTIKVVEPDDIDYRLEKTAGIIPQEEGFRFSAEGGVRAFVSADLLSVQMEMSKELLQFGSYTAWVPLSSMLRMYISMVFPQAGGLVFHGASIADEDGGYLFLGPSGAGKSTVCDLSPKHRIFNDEVSLVKRNEDGWQLLPSPFFSNQDRVNRATEAKKLSGLNLLFQSKQDRLEARHPARALGELMACLMNFLDDRIAAGRLLDLCSELVTQHPPQRLHFTKSPRFWDVLAESRIISK